MKGLIPIVLLAIAVGAIMHFWPRRVEQPPGTPSYTAPSDGYLLVRIDLESGVMAGAGSVAVLEFQALKRGVSPLSVHGVTYIEGSRQDTATTAEDHEGSITVY